MSWLSNSAKGAEYDSQGQARSASPLVTKTPRALRPEGPKYFALLGLGALFNLEIQGRRASRLPLAVIFRAFGAVIQALAPLREKYF